MLTKAEYRTWLCGIKPYVKLKPFVNMVNISASCLSYFMKGSEYDCLLSLDKLSQLYSVITGYFDNFA